MALALLDGPLPTSLRNPSIKTFPIEPLLVTSPKLFIGVPAPLPIPVKHSLSLSVALTLVVEKANLSLFAKITPQSYPSSRLLHPLSTPRKTNLGSLVPFDILETLTPLLTNRCT